MVINAGGIEKARNMSAPVVDYPSIRFNVNLNSSFNITCKTNSVNNSLTWHKDGSPEPLSLQQPDYTITRNGNESMLMFSEFSVARNGIYHCIAAIFGHLAVSTKLFLNTG